MQIAFYLSGLVAILATLRVVTGTHPVHALLYLIVSLIAVPILIQVYLNAGIAYWLSKRLGVAWCVAAPAATRVRAGNRPVAGCASRSAATGRVVA